MQDSSYNSMPSSSVARAVPFSLEAEQSVLGAIIIDPEKLREAAGVVKAEDFYVESHRLIFAAMQELFLQSRSIDIVTIIDTLEKSGSYTAEGGAEYIKTLAEAVPSVSNITDYARIIKDKSLLRSLINISEEISEMAYSAKEDVSGIIDSAEQKIFGIANGTETKDFVHIRDVLMENYHHLDLLIHDKQAAMGTPTYFSSVDKYLVGMGDSDLVLVGARPGMGKTSFCLNIASNVALKTKKTVAIFSLEMSASQLVSRMLSSEAMIDSYKMRTGELDDNDWVHLAQASDVLSKADILIDDTTGITVTGMKSKLRRVKNLGLVIIDYLQLMQSDKHTDNRVQEVGDISRNLKLMAKDLQVPVITCAQLSRGPESRTDKTPMLSDLRDSGAIEQDADTVMFLYRDDYYKDNPDMENVATCIIAKNRHGSTGKADLGWYGQYTKFTSIDREHAE